MSAQHPIFEHIERDAEGRPTPPPTAPRPGDASRAAANGALAGQPAQSAQTDQTASPDRPIGPKASLPKRVLRRLMLSPTADHPRLALPLPVHVDKTTERLVAAARRRWLSRDHQALRSARASLTGPYGQAALRDELVDVLTATPGETKLPDEVFAQLHWGGQFLYVGKNEKSVRNLAESYDGKSGFALEQTVSPIQTRTLGLRLPGLSTTGYAFLARKVRLLQPGDITERFTYDVELTRCEVSDLAPFGYAVTKRVPTYHDVLHRLRQKFPDVDPNDLRTRAHKLVDHVFPTFLTREAAMLGILQNNLAPEFRSRVPKPMGIEKDRRGFVRTLHMNWMRIGGQRISQLDFAIQSAELLAALHDQARVMHLDLRLDNMVITPDGVGFVDFGSACRVGEQVNKSPMLGSLFTEMMRTSQIQRMLGKMIERGHVTNNAIAEVYGKVDKTVDAFYLAVQIAKPHGNPDLKQYIDYRPDSDLAHALSALTAAVLRPKNPEMAQYKNATDLVRGLRRIERRVKK